MSVTAVPLQPVKSTYKIWLWLGIIAAVAGAFGLAWIGTGELRARAGTNEQFLAWNKGRMGVHTTASGLQYQVLKEGTGPTAVEQDGVAVEVFGTKRNGEEFQPKAPLQFRIGQPMIPGFTEGVKLMNKGAKYRLWLPPSLGYGAAPAGGPPNPLATEVLIFDVEVKELVPAATINQMMMQQMMQQGQGAPGQGAPGGPEGGPPAGGEIPQQ